MTIVSMAHRPGPPRGFAGGGRWLSIYSKAVLDVQTLAFHRYSLNSSEVLDQLQRFDGAEKPMLAFSPGGTQFVVAGSRDRPDEMDMDKRFDFALRPQVFDQGLQVARVRVGTATTATATARTAAQAGPDLVAAKLCSRRALFALPAAPVVAFPRRTARHRRKVAGLPHCADHIPQGHCRALRLCCDTANLARKTRCSRRRLPEYGIPRRYLGGHFTSRNGQLGHLGKRRADCGRHVFHAAKRRQHLPLHLGGGAGLRFKPLRVV
jgi:hypothetical protein